MNNKDGANRFDEGLGTVYERFMLNRFFEKLIDSYSIKEILEVPIYGTTGLTGINSVHFADKGCKVTLTDSRKDAMDEAASLWGMLPYDGNCRILFHDDLSQLPFPDGCFDLVWNFAALWHVAKPEALLSEMARVSSNLVLIIVPNKKQVGYLLRKYILDKEFFTAVDEKWAGISQICSVLSRQGLKLREKGLVDIPPWPDTCMPIAGILEKLGLRQPELQQGLGKHWHWDIMNYYQGKDRGLKQRVEKYSFIETLPIPRPFKAPLAHHKYILFSKN